MILPYLVHLLAQEDLDAADRELAEMLQQVRDRYSADSSAKLSLAASSYDE